MAACKTKTIEEIEELGEMFETMKAFGISSTGLKTLDEMKAKVKKELNAPVDKPSWTAGQVGILQKCYWVILRGNLFCRAGNSKTV